ncbi:LOW QUALITY PROTEIN: histone deacetylase 6 [Acipenser ruthenus]|uniref:LOW QUALITY PROTEIN: histone deacetylase 6 n=1 Tax=Acipenser ruthenus TaxID=7906 RepID=UPI002742859B|nr:LOW QUALITY PROTEIN: histone deacetylase 6 [Acipenser ruthenus]
MDSIPDPSNQRALRGSSRSPRSPGSASQSQKKVGKKGSQNSGLQEEKKKGRMNRSHGEEEMIKQLGHLDLRSSPVGVGTGLVFTEKCKEYSCLWDASHPECPDRLTAVMEKVEQYGLLSRCARVEERAATEEELLLVHSPEYVAQMRSTQHMGQEELQSLSDTFDSIYIHPESFHCACLAAGSVLQLVDTVMTAQLRNGFSIARPPGHHAQRDQMNGYCMFNNLAIAARYAKQRYHLTRILIVDWDVHHGQGLQYIFEDDPSVLVFSVHRYEDGRFWPHLQESDSTAVGKGKGEGFNINLPWNQPGMNDADYISAFQQLLLPVAYEFRPQLVLVAAGFDSVVGDPKGEMSATPACFAHLTHMLQLLAEGRLILSLEGGYNLRSTAEGVCACLKMLLGDPCPRLESPFSPCQSALDSISKTVAAHRKHWKCLQVLEQGQETGSCDLNPGPAVESDAVLDRSMREVMRGLPPARTGLVYDERMKEHHNMWDSHHPELPQRISRIFSRHEELGLVSRCQRIPARHASEEELALCHGTEHISRMKSTEGMKPRDLHRQSEEYNSIFISPQSYQSALLAAGASFNAAEAILTDKVRNAVAIVRPPGHHAERDSACGFCFFNTVALTARYAQRLSGRELRVLILDWDVHHGNGTQHIFEDDPSVLYVSLHRYDNGLFFPSSEDAGSDRAGRGRGLGYNVNIPWNASKMGNPEYIAAFQRVVMPIAYQFDPELVLVSAGFDAARGDPLGGCHVTPECYGHMTHMLQALAGGRVLIVLEGGYNLSSISESMSVCTSVLLGDSPPDLGQLTPPHPSAVQSLHSVLRTHRSHWSALRLAVPESVSSSLPTPSQKGQRTKAKKSPRQEVTPQKRSPGEDTHPLTPEGAATPDNSPSVSPAAVATVADDSVDQITAGLQSVALGNSPENQTNQSPASVAVGGARRKVKPASPEGGGKGQRKRSGGGESSKGTPSTPGKTEVVELKESAGKMESTEPPSLPAVAGDEKETLLELASGWSTPLKSQSICEVFCKTQDMEEGTMFAVEPLPWCPHLETVNPLPAAGLDVFGPCRDCGSEAENWVCLVCYQVHCGRYVNQHMMEHRQSSAHMLVLSFSDLSVWCYGCEAYVHHQVLHDAKNAAHRIKFGENMPGLH